MHDNTIDAARQYLAELETGEGYPPPADRPAAIGRLEGYLELALEHIESIRTTPEQDARIARALYDAHAYRMEGPDPDDIGMADEYAAELAARGGLGEIAPMPTARVPLSPAEIEAAEALNDLSPYDEAAATLEAQAAEARNQYGADFTHPLTSDLPSIAEGRAAWTQRAAGLAGMTASEAQAAHEASQAGLDPAERSGPGYTEPPMDWEPDPTPRMDAAAEMARAAAQRIGEIREMDPADQDKAMDELTNQVTARAVELSGLAADAEAGS